MPRPTTAKPPVAAWIIRERKRLAMKPPDIAARLTAMGLPVQEGTVRTWEAGRQPSPDNIEGLERVFGVEAPRPSESSAGLSELVSALNAQTEAITGLVGELRASLRGVERGLAAAAKLREGASSGGSNGPQSREGARR